MNRSIAVLLLVCVGTAASAQVLSEDFDGGVFPPPGWTVVDNTGNGGWLLNSGYGRANFTGGALECAAIDTDRIGLGLVDTELISPAVIVPAGAVLEFDHSFRWYSGNMHEQADLEISTGGGPWTLLRNFSFADDGYPVGVHHSIDLSAYAGLSAQVRFRLYNTNWDWWWQLDNVIIRAATSIPSLSEWGLALLATVMATGGLWSLARRTT